MPLVSHSSRDRAITARWSSDQSTSCLIRTWPCRSGSPAAARPVRRHGRHSRAWGSPAGSGTGPGELSGGQQQRVAIARALITRPAVLFGDEPTGALDSTTSREVLDMLRDLVDRDGQTIVMVTHDPVAASRADRVVFLVDGRVSGELAGPTVETVAARMTALETAGVLVGGPSC
ncbi:hypothetical protein STANM309S_01739 [Streptomyces tanashiensis]